jgi:hypothetical protein
MAGAIPAALRNVNIPRPPPHARASHYHTEHRSTAAMPETVRPSPRDTGKIRSPQSQACGASDHPPYLADNLPAPTAHKHDRTSDDAAPGAGTRRTCRSANLPVPRVRKRARERPDPDPPWSPLAHQVGLGPVRAARCRRYAWSRARARTPLVGTSSALAAASSALFLKPSSPVSAYRSLIVTGNV